MQAELAVSGGQSSERVLTLSLLCGHSLAGVNVMAWRGVAGFVAYHIRITVGYCCCCSSNCISLLRRRAHASRGLKWLLESAHAAAAAATTVCPE